MRATEMKIPEIPTRKFNGWKRVGKIRKLSKIWVCLTRMSDFPENLKMLLHSP